MIVYFVLIFSLVCLVFDLSLSGSVERQNSTQCGKRLVFIWKFVLPNCLVNCVVQNIS